MEDANLKSPKLFEINLFQLDNGYLLLITGNLFFRSRFCVDIKETMKEINKYVTEEFWRDLKKEENYEKPRQRNHKVKRSL